MLAHVNLQKKGIGAAVRRRKPITGKLSAHPQEAASGKNSGFNRIESIGPLNLIFIDQYSAMRNFLM
jgi:hypothetical protein